MGIARIVTDSAAELSQETVDELGITVVPLRIKLGAELLVDEPSLRSPDFYRRIAKSRALPMPVPPSMQELADVYQHLARESSDVVCIHVMSAISRMAQAAQQARAQFLGRCQISVIDSGFVSRAQGILVTEAAKACREGANGAEVVRLVRGLMARVYLAFYVESTDYLRRAGVAVQSREPITGTSGTKPLLLLEEGEVTPLHRQRSRGTPVERLAEFVTEFSQLRQLAVLHAGPTRTTEDLKALLKEHLPKLAIEEHVYGPAFGSFVGPGALGVVVFEG